MCQTCADAAAKLAETVSACTAGATKASRQISGLVLKADDEKRFLLTVAYPAMKADTSVAADGHIDFASAPVVEEAAWNFLRKGAKVGLWHRPGHEDAADVVESYIWRGDPWALKAADGTDQTIMPGDWLVGMVLSPATWDLYKSGAIGGVSPQGTAKRKDPDPATLAQLRS